LIDSSRNQVVKPREDRPPNDAIDKSPHKANDASKRTDGVAPIDIPNKGLFPDDMRFKKNDPPRKYEKAESPKNPTCESKRFYIECYDSPPRVKESKW